MQQVGVTGRDVERMLAIVHGYGPEPDDEPLPWELLLDVKELVPCDLLSASGQDTPNWEFFANQELPVVQLSPQQDAELAVIYQSHYWSSACSYPDRTGDLAYVHRDSDLVPDRMRRRTPMYREFDHPLGIEHELMVCLDAGGPQRTLRLLFARGPGSDFSERDVAVLALLRPHLQAAYDERRRRGRLPLTGRQREILQFVAAGYANRQIARRLEVSEGTVRKHLENIFVRLEVTGRTAAVARLRTAV